MGSALKDTKAKDSIGLKKISSLTETPKTVDDLPEGSEIIKKDVSVTVEEIENGFLITKNFDIKYILPKKDNSYPDYLYYAKKWYSKDNPLEIRTDDKSLADLFD